MRPLRKGRGTSPSCAQGLREGLGPPRHRGRARDGLPELRGKLPRGGDPARDRADQAAPAERREVSKCGGREFRLIPVTSRRPNFAVRDHLPSQIAELQTLGFCSTAELATSNRAYLRERAPRDRPFGERCRRLRAGCDQVPAAPVRRPVPRWIPRFFERMAIFVAPHRLLPG